MGARAVGQFPTGKGWAYESKWDGFRCLVFRNVQGIYLQSKARKSLNSGFPDIVTAFAAVNAERFVLDGELAIPCTSGFSFDALLNRLWVGAARLALEVRDRPAIFVPFDMLADTKSLANSPFELRRQALERFFQISVSPGSPIYLSNSTEDPNTVEGWIGHIGRQLDGIIAKRTDAPYLHGDDRSIVKVKNYRSCDCVIGGFRDHSIGSRRNQFLLGLYDPKGRLHYVGSTDVEQKQKREAGQLKARKTTPFLRPSTGSAFNFIVD